MYQQNILTLTYLEFPLEPGFVQVLSQHVWRSDSEDLQLKVLPHLPVGWSEAINIQQKCQILSQTVRTPYLVQRDIIRQLD